MSLRRPIRGALLSVMGGVVPVYAAQVPQAVEAEGTVHAPATAVPFSSLASPEAKAAFTFLFAASATQSVGPSERMLDIAAKRLAVDVETGVYARSAQALYRVTVTPRTLGGVPTEVYAPREGVAPRNKNRILINLHGGAFLWGGRPERAAESIPIAAIGRIAVVSVDYRLGPEHQFPAASEDVAAVYRALLQDHDPSNIGIYGCSAGGLLAGEAIAWFVKEGLPVPGAIGVLCAALGPPFMGDSAYMAAYLTGQSAEPGGQGAFGMSAPYFGDADPKDPLVYPQNSSAVLRRFPPTLLISGTRAPELSAVTASQLRLLEAGVEAELSLWDGMWHGFLTDPTLPESKEADERIVRFFDRHLGKRASQHP